MCCDDDDYDLSDAMRVNHGCSVDLDYNVRSKMKEINNTHETIFKWEIKQETGTVENILINFSDKIREKYEMITDDSDTFSLNKLCLQLISCYEFFISGSYYKSLWEIQNIVKFMESGKLCPTIELYFTAYNHLVQATYAYIALSLNLDSEKMLKDAQQITNLGPVEKSALCALKAKVFIEYPPNGYDIAIKYAALARNYHSTELEWIAIWLKAKGRKRRYYNIFEIPEKNEIDAADVLCTVITNHSFLMQASMLYNEIAFFYTLTYNREESDKYYKLSSELTLKGVELAKDNEKQLYFCLLVYIDFPNKFQQKTVIHSIILKLLNIKNGYVCQALGKYYLKCEQNYEKAKIYLSRGMAAGHFESSLQLLKVECMIQSINKYPLIQTLNMLYVIFRSPKRRLIILSQILLYFYYYENKPKELIKYLNTYLNQEIELTLKKQHLIFASPLFIVNTNFRPRTFFYLLSEKIKDIKNCDKWSLEEQITLDDTLFLFRLMEQVKVTNSFDDNEDVRVLLVENNEPKQ